MSNDERVQTFFPNQRKHVKVLPGGTGPGKTGDVRYIQLALKMELSDGKLVGMPDYIGQAYAVLAKEGSLLDSPKVLVTLSGVSIALYATEKSADASLEVEECVLSKFVMTREKAKKEGEMDPIHLRFVLQTNGWVPKLWKWLGDNFQSEFWIGFGGTQMTLELIGPAAVDEEDEEEPAQMQLTEAEQLEKDRKEATSPAMDSVFGKPVVASKGKSHAMKKAEAALGGKGPALVQ